MTLLKTLPAVRKPIWIGKTAGFAVTTVVSALLALMADAEFADFWTRTPLGTLTYPPALALLRMNPKSHIQKIKLLNPGTQGGKIESSAATKAASAPLVRMAGVMSVA